MHPVISYATVYVSDFKKAIDFYDGILGLPVLYVDEKFGYARLDGGGVGLGLAAVAENAPNFDELVGRHTGIAVAVADIDEAYAELVEKGVQFPMELDMMPWGRKLAEFSDPDGNVLFLDTIEE